MRYILIKKGSATKIIPEKIRMYRFEVKYGNTIKPMPLKSGMMAFCFLP